jgi:uncharacterized protein YdhG (YjbR/CyaY superfamily)
MVKNQPAKTVDEYLATLPQETRVVLENLRQAIKSAAPQAEEVISYQIPTYKYHGALVHFMAGRQDCSFITVSKSIIEKFKSELKGYKLSGTTIHFSAQNPLPNDLVKQIVKFRMKENESRYREKENK